ncbi:helix-turn-helix transcriptional regulator [Paludibacterium purpuratum]|uniref:AraC family transcriptional regulator n=1 Tax=Paludibacterium purpuratum TaxID=1144873 RepID=A0A4R7BDG5_9NEIS|nr:helix-turn-helix transcriptional regulator [Paludibacterium purpuratum]TDR82015.1 AraC family transcriptional regulator [Paludibacterium purpuratum]
MQAAVYREIRVSRGQVAARRMQVLHRVSILTPALCHVRHGCKQVQWQGRIQQAGAGQLVLMPAGVELGVINQPGPQGYLADLVSLPEDWLQHFRQRLGASLPVQRPNGLCVELDAHSAGAWALLLAALATDAPAPLLQHHVEGVLLALALAGNAAWLLRGRDDALSARIQQLLLQNPAADWEAAGVAQQLHLGTSTLRRHLAREGRQFRDILDEVRMNHALQALQSSRLPIGEIAAQSGYASASRFAVRFRQRFGLSPRDLRQTV